MATATPPRVSTTDHAVGIVSRHAVIPVDDHPGYFYVMESAASSELHIASSLDCACAASLAGERPCTHMAAVQREAAALLAYAADWDRSATALLQNAVARRVTACVRHRRRLRGGWRRRHPRHSDGRASRNRLPPGVSPSGTSDDDLAAMDAALEREELEAAAQDLLGLLVLTKHDKVLEAAAPIPWKLGMALITDPDAELRRLALTLALDAVLERPDVLVAAVRDLHGRLVAVAPRLELPVRTTQEAGDARQAR